uniref:Protein brambleberry n=1 Tax=Clastoptera arizonana TaxID=38151 RepID=A0A1B6DF22_9HEMI
MTNIKIVTFILILLVYQITCASIFEWLGLGLSSDKNPSSTVHLKDGTPLIPIPFEELSPEEKFLQEAKKYTSLQLSQLDSCQHKLIMKIQTSCGGITEEDLAKLSVQLLNCQSETEGRTLFSCTDKMNLKDCTSKMDSDTWNAYLLMNNRARAVCYAARQQQFRASSEMTVNKLMTTAHKQIESIDQLQALQNQIGDAAETVLTTFLSSQKNLIEQESVLRIAHESIRNAVARNFNQLKEERGIINTGRTELLQMVHELGNKLDIAQRQVQDQSVASKSYHEEVIDDLETIAYRADRIWHKIDEGSKLLLQQQKVSTIKYEESLRNLERINITVCYLLDLFERTQSQLDLRLRWIIDIMGDTEEELDRTMFLLQHLVFLTSGMIFIVFLQASPLTRFTLLILVCGNIIIYKLSPLYEAVSFVSLTGIVVSIMLGEILFRVIYCKRIKERSNIDKNRFATGSQKSNVTLQPANGLDSLLNKTANIGTNNCSQYTFKRFSKPSSEYSHKSESDSRRSETSDEDEGYSGLHQKRNLSLKSLTSPNSSRSGTPSYTVCKSLCRNGQLCRNTASKNGDYCFRHIKS